MEDKKLIEIIKRETDESVQDTKNIDIKPIKSSNEIVAELFKVFNAEPPKQLLVGDFKEDPSKPKKHKKKHHKDAHKTVTTDETKKHKSKHKKSARRSDHEQPEVVEYIKTKHIKIETHKNATVKTEIAVQSEVKKNVDKIKGTSNVDKNKIFKDYAKEEQSCNERVAKEKWHGAHLLDYYDVEKRHAERNDRQESRRHHARRSSRSRSRRRSRSRCRRSSRSRSKRSSRSRRRRSRSGSCSRRSTRDRSRNSSRRAKDLGIDKDHLLEIARKNAISMFKRGAVSYGGKTVEDLTEFCTKISNGTKTFDDDDDNDDKTNTSETSRAVHHPFQLKVRDPIMFQINKPKTLEKQKTENLCKVISLQFPVSSGQDHRISEMLPTVEAESPKKAVDISAAICENKIPNAVENKQAVDSDNAINTEKIAVKAVDSETASNSLPASTKNNENVQTSLPLPPDASVPKSTKYAALSKPFIAAANLSTVVMASTYQQQQEQQKQQQQQLQQQQQEQQKQLLQQQLQQQQLQHQQQLQQQQQQLQQPALPDVSTIVANRLSAMRRLQNHNNHAPETSYNMNITANGIFTGKTGAHILSRTELNRGPQVWARPDQFSSTQPLNGGVGMYLLQKMGWKPGEGLGRERNGALEPLLLDIKMDKKGLIAKSDRNHKHTDHAVKNRYVGPIDYSDKHPVCLLNELAAQRKCSPPLYTLVNEAGPAHNKLFRFSVAVNGQLYTPENGSNTKKEAKLIAAKYCLQQLNILPY